MGNPLKISPGVSGGEVFVCRIPLFLGDTLRLDVLMGRVFLKYAILWGMDQVWEGGGVHVGCIVLY